MTEPISTEEPHLNKIALLQRIIEQLNSAWSAECSPLKNKPDR